MKYLKLSSIRMDHFCGDHSRCYWKKNGCKGLYLTDPAAKAKLRVISLVCYIL
jgi:hypothetical protein